MTATVLSAAILTGCGGGDDGPAALADHTVYAMTNSDSGNAVIAFRRAHDGQLTLLGNYPTGGNGLGATEISAATPNDGIDVLASQYSLNITPDKHVLVAVNAGSASITSFVIARDGTLTAASTQPSGGRQPNAIGIRNDLVYVGNVGDSSNGFASNISGFSIDSNGVLTPIAGSTRKLSTPTSQPAAVTFNPSGTLVAVSELTADTISVFTVATDGTLTTPVANASAGAGPFGSAFLSNGRLLVTQASATAPGAASSYEVAATGVLTPISASISNGQIATCWAIVDPDEKTLYANNTGSGNVSSYTIGSDGSLTLKEAIASTLEGPQSGAVDGGISEDGKYFYVQDSGPGAITAHRINADGTLTKIQTVTGQGLPTLGIEGLIVR